MSTRLLVVALSLIVPSAAAAQSAGAPPPHPREGFLGGFALHAGEIACEGDACDGISEAGGISGHVGWGFSPKLAGVFDVWAMGHTEDNLTLTHTIATFNLRYAIVPILWVQGGLGGAQARWRYDGPFDISVGDHTDNVPAVAFAAGLELLRSPRFSLDVQLRVGVGFYDDDDNQDGQADQTGRSSSVAVGFTWF